MTDRSSARSVSVAATAILLFAAAIPSWANPEGGAKILSRTGEFYESLRSMRASVEIRIELPEEFAAMGAKPDPERYEFVLARPARVAALPADGAPGPSFVQDGKRQYADMPPFRRYVLTDAVPLKELMLAAGSIPGFDIFLGFGMDEQTPGSLRGFTGVKLLPDESIEGTECRHLALEAVSGRSEIWIARTERPWVMRYRMEPPAPPPVPEPEESGTGGMIMFQPGIDIFFRDWQADPELSDAFRIRPREDFERVEMLLPPPDEMPDFFAGLEEGHPSIDKPAPDLRLKPLSGDTIELSSLAGKIVVLDFWATWCVPCIIELPVVSKVTKELEDRGVVFYAVNRGESKKIVRDFLKKRELDLPVVMDGDDSISSAFGVEGMPHLVIIDRTKIVRKVHFGAGPGSEERLRTEIKALLAE